MIGCRTRREAYERNDLCGLGGEFVGKLFVVGDQVSDVDVAIVFLDKSVLAELVSAAQSDMQERYCLVRFD